MKQPSSTLCLLVLLGGLCLTACGGGGGNVPPGGGGGLITAAFTPSNPAPGVNSISMQPGTATNDTFQIVVNVTDIVDFFGAAFRVVFDSTSAEFLSFDDSTSFLHNHPDSPVVNIRAEIDLADPDSVLVVATLQQTFLYIPGFTFTAPDDGDQVLLILTFRATSPTAGNPFTFGIAATREVSTCEPPPMIGPTPACIMVADGNLTWNGGTMSAN